MATKRLARQLGLIRRKSIIPANGNLGTRKSKQAYDYLIVIDFESTCWNDGKRHNSPEIIEFPAVLLSTSTGEIECEFHTYVQPQEHPVLSEFCMELTGIKVQVDEGVPLKICLSQFCKWISKIQQQKKIIFASEVTEPTSEVKLCAFVTWSGLDDSRNTALLAWKMIRDGCLMKITRSSNKGTGVCKYIGKFSG
uniref:Exonuclease domain-containing protein n=1 Tax=Jaculus jaculus TaxID=51337 RepID=A0A8C5LEU5_JACJA